MARWLVKTDPRLFSFADLEAAGTVVWNGVRQAAALRHLARVRRGDPVLVYHGGGRSRVAGIARAKGDAFVDPEGESPQHVAVELEAVRALPRPVPTADLRRLGGLEDWELLRVPRLTVLPVPPQAWRAVERLAAAGKNVAGPSRRR